MKQYHYFEKEKYNDFLQVKIVFLNKKRASNG